MSYTLLSEAYPKAREEHICIWCGEKIETGETYRHEKSVFYGNMQNHKWHLECQKAWGDEFAEFGNEEFSPGDNERPSEHLGFSEIGAINHEPKL